MPPADRHRVVEVAPERFEGWSARFAQNNPDGPQRIVTVDRFDADPVFLVLLRRGGYAIGVGADGRLARHSTGTRYVQSRTAAGGWSQQRFARRRSGQADALVKAVADKVVRIRDEWTGPALAGLVVGGDKALIADVFDDARLQSLTQLPRRDLYDLPDPRLTVLQKAFDRGRSVRVTISDGQ